MASEFKIQIYLRFNKSFLKNLNPWRPHVGSDLALTCQDICRLRTSGVYPWCIAPAFWVTDLWIPMGCKVRPPWIGLALVCLIKREFAKYACLFNLLSFLSLHILLHYWIMWQDTLLTGGTSAIRECCCYEWVGFMDISKWMLGSRVFHLNIPQNNLIYLNSVNHFDQLMRIRRVL